MFLGSKPKNLLDVLISQGKLKEIDVTTWRKLDSVSLDYEIRKSNLVSSEDLGRAYAQAFNLQYIELKNLKIPPEALAAIPEDVAKQYKIIAYALVDKPILGRTLKIAVANPATLLENVKAKIEELEKKKGIKIEVAITSFDDFGIALSQYSLANQTLAETARKEEAARLPEIDLRTKTIPFEVISKFPEEISRKYNMVVFESDGPREIKVALGDPTNEKAKELLHFVKEKNNINIIEYRANPSDVMDSLRYYAPAPEAPLPQSVPPKGDEKPAKNDFDDEIGTVQLKPITKPLPPQVPAEEKVPEVIATEKEKPLVMPQNNLDSFLGINIEEVDELEKIAKENNVPKTVAAIVALAAFKKSSDIHIEPTEKNLRVRYRVDGILKDIIKLPLEMHPAIVSRIKILSSLKIDETRVPQDGRFDVITGGHAIDFRVSTLPTVFGEKIALRILDKSARLFTLEELGLVGKSLKILTDNIDKPYGTILSTGPTGSGKSTTLYAILNRISTASVNIVTLEDPVEYEIPGINQCQIKPKIGFTFANGLRSILRQDPNVIMVGEIRDSETAALAVHAALTGHLVLSTLHTNDAAGALLRLVNMGVEPFLITSSVNVVIAQRLVRKLCPKCKMPAHIPGPIAQSIDKELAGFNFPKPYQFFEGRGCNECEQGYKGRIGIFEVMPMNEEIESLVTSRKQSSEIKATAIKNGMVTMKQDGLIKALKGLTTVNEVLRVISV